MVIDIAADELKKYIKDHRESEYLLIDVREPKEYAVSHIPGALLIPLKEVEIKALSLDTDKEVIFYCRSGRRSKIAAEFVDSIGLPFKRILNLSGGILAWQDKALPGFPRFITIDTSKGVEQVLRDAIGFEKAAGYFYETAAHMFSDSLVATMASHLATFEIGHAKTIYGLLKRLNPETPSFEEIYDASPINFLEGGLLVEEVLERLKSMEGEMMLNLAEIALDMEFMAYELYKNCAVRANDMEMAKTFFQLAEQEKGHIRIISHYFGK